MVCPSGLTSRLIHEPSFVEYLILRTGFSGKFLYCVYFTVSFFVESPVRFFGQSNLLFAFNDKPVNKNVRDNAIKRLPFVSFGNCFIYQCILDETRKLLQKAK